MRSGDRAETCDVLLSQRAPAVQEVPRPPMSTWVDGTRKVMPIELEAGHMVLATPSGDELSLDYRAPG